MKSAIITTATASALAAGALGFAGDAKAVPLEGSAADQAVASLQARGFNVQIDGATSSSLSRCTVTSINGLRGAAESVRVHPSSERRLNCVETVGMPPGYPTASTRPAGLQLTLAAMNALTSIS
jgi:hypothetical protein